MTRACDITACFCLAGKVSSDWCLRQLYEPTFTSLVKGLQQPVFSAALLALRKQKEEIQCKIGPSSTTPDCRLSGISRQPRDKDP